MFYYFKSLFYFCCDNVNLFTALACKISGLKDAWKRLQTVYFPVLHLTYFQYYALMKIFSHATVSAKKKQKGVTVKPVLNWANVCSPEHTSDTSTNYNSFLNWTFSSPNMVRTIQTLLRSQLACNEMQASARTCGRRAADSMIENVGSSQVNILSSSLTG